MRLWQLHCQRIQAHTNLIITLQSSHYIVQMTQHPFDLSTLLTHLTTLTPPYTHLTILTLTKQQLHLKVMKILNHKEKIYKIMCTPIQAENMTKILASTMSKFKEKKIVVRSDIIQESKQQEANRNVLYQLLRNVNFDQIILQGQVTQPYKLLQTIYSLFTTTKISFQTSMPLTLITQTIPKLHNQLYQQHIILYFNVMEIKQTEILEFAAKWVESLPNVLPPLPKEKYFGYPFPRKKGNMKLEGKGRKEQISVMWRDRQVITARQLQQQGRAFIVSLQPSVYFLSQLTSTLFSPQKAVALQINPLPSQSLVLLAEEVVLNYNYGYRLVIGHQLELCPCRIILNTLDLNQKQVQRMMKIAAEAGRYQIVLYSELKYFENAFRLFLAKPLIKFNFFLPLQQWTQNTQILMNKIQKHCQTAKKHVFSYAVLLDRYSHLGYVFVNSIFEALTSIQEQC